MITYQKTYIGLLLLCRIHGSPLFKATIPGLVSVTIFLLINFTWIQIQDEDGIFEEAYGIGVLVSGVSFLIIFRANYSYQRYWSACGDAHQMMSKWLDAALHSGIYHMQQSHYDCIKPPSYFDNHDLNRLQLSRDREKEDDFFEGSVREQEKFRQRRFKIKSIETSRRTGVIVTAPGEDPRKAYSRAQSVSSIGSEKKQAIDLETGLVDDRKYLFSEGRLDGGWGSLYGDSTSTYHETDSGIPGWKRGNEKGFASTYPGGRTPSLFLQELVHLASLCNAVAFSTLRNDIEFAKAPLDMHHPGSKFPETDPKQDIEATENWTTLRYLFGLDRTPEGRTRYIASRPLPVLGGVSLNEIKFLQRAQGPSAKVALAYSWLCEFIMREQDAGSLGNVGPPVISRVMQFLSDGMLSYNHCRKTMFIPFPFPAAQLSAFFVVIMVIAVPLMVHQYSTRLWLGAMLTFMTVTCLAGLHEVSRELENPFRNIPNEIPLLTLQAMFNESLITIYSGYHPDHFWDPDEYRLNGKRCETPTGDASWNNQKSNKPPSPCNQRLNTPRPPSKISFEDSSVVKEDISVNELREMVTKQSEEIKLLTEIFDSRSISFEDDTRGSVKFAKFI